MATIPGRELVFASNPLNEQVVLAAAIVSKEKRAELLRHPADVFLTDEHRATWAAVREADRRGLACDPATLAQLSGGAVELGFLEELISLHQTVPDDKTLEFHVEALLWDRQRHVALTGPISGLLESIQKHEPPERVRALARQVAGTFEGWSSREYLHDAGELIRAQMADVRRRVEGLAVYPTGLRGLDYFDPKAEGESRRRLIPGLAPGLVTVMTGNPGSGKSTLTARIVLGLARQKRRVLYGAWEMTGGVTLELLACMSLNWSRSDLIEGRIRTPEGAVDEERMGQLEERMRAISKWVRFMANPFRRRSGERASNERNLDLVAGYIADTGCDVFVADLWKRCLVKTAPEDEEEALFRQQAIAEELGVHAVLVHQQRKDVEVRADQRPTREGIKGSGAWVEVADNIFGVYRQALFKNVPDNTMEVDVLKQRYGKWPLAIEFEWDPDRGMISGGTSIEYDRPGASETSNELSKFLTTPMKKKKE